MPSTTTSRRKTLPLLIFTIRRAPVETGRALPTAPAVIFIQSPTYVAVRVNRR
jgi:hypothetical protein